MKKGKDMRQHPLKNSYPRYRGGHMRPIQLWLPKAYFEKLDTLVEHGLYPSRSEAIRLFIKDGLKQEILNEAL